MTQLRALRPEEVQHLYETLCMVLTALQDCETLLRELDAEPELVAGVAKVQALGRQAACAVEVSHATETTPEATRPTPGTPGA